MRRIADMTDQILKGAKPGDIPFYQPTKLELVLNRTTIAGIGVSADIAGGRRRGHRMRLDFR